MKKVTESESRHHHLESKSILQILSGINEEDYAVPKAISLIIPDIEKLVQCAVSQLKKGGRIFYIGAGTSGRLGVVDASECPPTFGVPHGLVVGIMAGGDQAIRKAVEFAEDDTKQGWQDLMKYSVNENDIVIGIAASGTTPYVISALEKCQENNIPTGCITCNPGSPITQPSDFPVVAEVGPEYVTGSTRMKSGTAQKLILNMISTASMIQLGRVKGNRMVDMQLSNNKLVDRGTKMIMEETGLTYESANELLVKHGSVRMAVEQYSKS